MMAITCEGTCACGRCAATVEPDHEGVLLRRCAECTMARWGAGRPVRAPIAAPEPFAMVGWGRRAIPRGAPN
jgi:hypothetical protein